MTARNHLSVILPVLLGLTLTGCQTDPGPGIPIFDSTSLEKLQLALSCEEDGLADTPLVLVTYLPNEACISCVNRELKNIRAFARSGPDLSFLFVVQEGNPFVSGLKKTGLLRCPLFLERDDLGLEETFQIVLLSTVTGKPLMYYLPDVYSNDAWADFERGMREKLKAR